MPCADGTGAARCATMAAWATRRSCNATCGPGRGRSWTRSSMASPSPSPGGRPPHRGADPAVPLPARPRRGRSSPPCRATGGR